MNILRRDDLEKLPLPGRVIQKAVGADGASVSQKMTVGFGRYSAESGPMAPHRHAEETVLILDAREGTVRFGPSPERLDELVALEPGMVLHIPDSEWHVFEYGPGGHVDIVFYYGQVDDIRPEEGAGS